MRRVLLEAALTLLWLTSAVLAQQHSASPRMPNAPPDSPLAIKAQSALAQGDSSKAIAILTSYLQTHPRDASARAVLAQAYVVIGQNDRGEAEFQTILKDNPEDVRALAGIGEIYLHEGQLDKAEALLGHAAKANGAGPGIRMRWAFALARLHKYEEARSVLSTITPPPNPEERIEFRRLKASVASGLGNPKGAASEMEQALALQPQDAALTLATALAELQVENWHRAADLSQHLYARSHDPQAGLVLLEAKLGMHEDFRDTLKSLRDTTSKRTDEPAFRERLAEILISHAEFSASIEDLARAVELEPQRADLKYNLALAEFKAGRLEESLKSADQCRALEDTAEIEDLLGDIQEARGDNLGAVKSYQAAVKIAPDEEKYRLSLAVEFIRHNSFDAARVALQQTEEMWPKSWRVQLALGLVEHFTGSDEEAGRILMHAADLAPEPGTALQYLGNIQMDQAAAPTPAAITQICNYSDRHPGDGKVQYYCGGLLFRSSYISRDTAHVDEILRRLSAAAKLLADDASPHCQMGRVLRWVERWEEARGESEVCVRMDPNSADGHYRLAQIYQHLGESGRGREEMALYTAASQRMANENARRDETMKTFLYTIQKEGSPNK